MKPPLTISSLKSSACWHLNTHLEELPKGKKKKYGNVGVEIDGIKFMSKREAARYVELRMLKVAGLITDLRLQVPYELNEGGTYSYKYIADFVYLDERGIEIIEDSKGYKTEVYKKKKLLMLKIYGIEIKET